jgi:hypothetical protein
MTTINNLHTFVSSLISNPSDINEHIPTLIRYSKDCRHITEMGVRGIVSTWAFLVAKPQKLISIDMQDPKVFGGNIDLVYQCASDLNVDFQFKLENTLNINIENTDLLFIDTWHCYRQLKAELNLHNKNVNKYIILHDTTTYAHQDEKSYEHLGEEWKARENGGIWKALKEFISENQSWEIYEKYANNNGLTVLKKFK